MSNANQPGSVENGIAKDAATELRQKVGMGRSHRVRRWIWRIVPLLVVAGGVVAFLAWRKSAAKQNVPKYSTEAVQQGDLNATVTATGTLSGVDTVEVGAQVTGSIMAIHADFNDRVKKGELLLEIDPEQLTASRNQASARLVSAQASYASAKATAKETKLVAARQHTLSKQGLISDQDLESADAAAERAQAQVRSSAADIALARAALEQAQTNLDKAKIKSPIDGVVLSRAVEVGQTVTSGFQTPVLFTLARDLKEMQLSIAIDEADIGRVKQGQDASFTVDAYPNRKFPATLKQLRNVPTTVDNVVTYEAILRVDNADGVLRPGMTATATIVTVHRDNAILVPNAALRFKPPSTGSSGHGGPPGLRMFSGRSRPPAGAAPKKKEDPNAPHVWVLANNQPKRVAVKIGVSDGQVTEVLSGVKPGQKVIVDVTGGG
jgi:HlyD family secretion protein